MRARRYTRGMPYSPFAKQLRYLEPADLSVLRRTTEGWFVEYKRAAPPDAEALAKTISAFANHNGGWLFVGVAEAKDGSRVAGSFPGIPSSSVGDLTNRLKDTVSRHVSPSPHYEHRVLVGPCDAIGLPATQSVLVIRVPEGSNPPYVSSGRIFRRKGDASEPVAETDRSVFDMLIEKGRRRRVGLRELLDEEPELSKAEDDTPVCQIFVIPDPLGDRENDSTLEFTNFCASVHGKTGLTFDNVFSTAQGWIARHVFNNRPSSQLLTWEHRYSGVSIFTFPLRMLSESDAAGYSHGPEFYQLLAVAGVDTAIDCNLLMTIVHQLLQLHFKIASEGSITPEPHFAKVRASGLWRKTSFLDTKPYVEHVKKYGLPVLQNDKTLFPPGSSLESLYPVQAKYISDQDMGSTPTQLSIGILNALGLPDAVLQESIPEIGALSERASRVHRGDLNVPQPGSSRGPSR